MEWEGIALCGKRSSQEYTFQKLVLGNQQSEQFRAPVDCLVLGISFSGMVECSQVSFISDCLIDAQAPLKHSTLKPANYADYLKVNIFNLS